MSPGLGQPLPPAAGGAAPADPGHPGRVAAVQAQVILAAMVVIGQLWLVTEALDQLLSGRGSQVWPLAAVSTLALGAVLLVMRAYRGV
jgi:hypothetical protein